MILLLLGDSPTGARTELGPGHHRLVVIRPRLSRIESAAHAEVG